MRYDREADVLYMWSIEPEKIGEIITKEIGDEILLKKNIDTDKVHEGF